jgi:hypothetical protein
MEREFQYALATEDGRELAQQDINLAAATAGLADDHVLAELLRLAPYDGTRVYKAIIPSGYRSTTGVPHVQTVSPGTGVVTISPFRMVVGSRNAVNAAPNDNASYPNPAGDSAALANWRDLRSGVYVGSSTSLTGTLTPANNASGNARWDLVYAAITVDQTQGGVTRRVKNPTTGVLSAPTLPAFLLSPVTVGIVTGTPGAAPALPSLPADAAGVYYVALAYVAIPPGFTGGTTVLVTEGIRSTTICGSDGAGANPVPTAARFSPLHAGRIRAANGNNDGNNAGTGSISVYSDSSNAAQFYAPNNRPNGWCPPDWVGGEEIFIQLDLLIAATASHVNGAIVDNSTDWRARIFRVEASLDPGIAQFATSPACVGAGSGTSAAVGVPYCPNPIQTYGGSSPPYVTLANSLGLDAAIGGASSSTLLYLDGSTTTPYGVGALLGSSAANKVGLYVDSTGAMRVFIAGVPGASVFIWVRATGKMPNA